MASTTLPEVDDYLLRFTDSEGEISSLLHVPTYHPFVIHALTKKSWSLPVRSHTTPSQWTPIPFPFAPTLHHPNGPQSPSRSLPLYTIPMDPKPLPVRSLYTVPMDPKPLPVHSHCTQSQWTPNPFPFTPSTQSQWTPNLFPFTRSTQSQWTPNRCSSPDTNPRQR